MNVTRDVLPLDPSKRRLFVPTMGALHAGHRELMRVARERAGDDGEVVVSIFVNPTQFGAGEDLDAYPRTREQDEAVCRSEGVDVLFAPTVDDVYGTRSMDARVTVEPGPLGLELEGTTRPTHFAGVLSVVALLFHKVRPDAAIFGEKDYQQLELIRRMNDDLGFGIDIVGVGTVRDDDGLALSSRNSYLSQDERRLASAIPRALTAAQNAAPSGANAARQAAVTILDDASMEIDYVDVRSNTLGSPPDVGAARLLVACRVGTTRLIDNCALDLGTR